MSEESPQNSWSPGALSRLFLGAFLLSLAFQSGARPVNDGYAAFVVAEGIVDDGEWDYYPGYSPGYSVLGPDGRAYGKFGLGMSLLMVPSLWTAKVLSLGVDDPTQSSVLQAIAHRVPLALMAALAFLLLAVWGRVWMSLSASHSLLLACGAILCTPAWVYFRVFYAEGMLTLAWIGTLVLTSSWRHHKSRTLLVFGGGLAGLGLLAKPIGLLLIAGGGLLLWEPGDRTKQLVRKWSWFVLGAIPPTVLALAYNWVRTGSLLGSTYTEGIDQFGFSTPIWEGLWGLLVSPGKGLVFFAPLALLGAYGWLRSPSRRVSWVVLGLSLSFLLVSSAWWAWHGGECWGPRLLVPVLPVLCMGVGFLPFRQITRRTFAGCIVVGGIVSLLGVAVPWQAHYDRVPYQSWAEAMHEAEPDAAVEVLGKDNLEHVHGEWRFSGIPSHAWLLVQRLGDQSLNPPWGSPVEEAQPYGLNTWVLWPEDHRGSFGALFFFLLLAGGIILGSRGVSLFVR